MQTDQRCTHQLFGTPISLPLSQGDTILAPSVHMPTATLFKKTLLEPCANFQVFGGKSVPALCTFMGQRKAGPHRRSDNCQLPAVHSRASPHMGC